MTKFMDTLKKLTPTGFSYPIENTEIFIEATEKEKDVLLFISMLKHNIRAEKKTGAENCHVGVSYGEKDYFVKVKFPIYSIFMNIDEMKEVCKRFLSYSPFHTISVSFEKDTQILTLVITSMFWEII